MKLEMELKIHSFFERQPSLKVIFDEAGYRRRYQTAAPPCDRGTNSQFGRKSIDGSKNKCDWAAPPCDDYLNHLFSGEPIDGAVANRATPSVINASR